MQFPSESTITAKLAVLTKTFRYRCGPMMLVAALFIANEAPRMQAFGLAIFGWVVCEAFIKLHVDTKKP